MRIKLQFSPMPEASYSTSNSEVEVFDESVEGYRLIEEVVKEMEACLNLLFEKDKDYQGAWREQGYMGQTARILSKASRLKNMLWRMHSRESASEPLQDTVRDLANLCFLWLLNRKHGNTWGRGS